MYKKERGLGRGLGRGLDALISPSANLDAAEIREIKTADIHPGENQPRRNFDAATLEELAQSVREHGILQPLLVRLRGGEYELVAGERRWRAAQLAGLETVPALVKEINEKEAAEISLIENIQRDDLNMLEEARAYQQLMAKHGYTQEEIGSKIGKSRSYITNSIRLLNLPPEIQQMLEEKQLSSGHARALLALTEAPEQKKLAQRIVQLQLSVRETEKLIQQLKEPPQSKKTRRKPGVLLEIEEKLQNLLGTKTEIITQKRGGKIEIKYYSDEELERILETLGIEL